MKFQQCDPKIRSHQFNSYQLEIPALIYRWGIFQLAVFDQPSANKFVIYGKKMISITVSTQMPNIAWPFQEPKLEVPSIYKTYFSGLYKGIPPQHIALNGVAAF